jgi:hypothetical protein
MNPSTNCSLNEENKCWFTLSRDSKMKNNLPKFKMIP